MEDEDLSNMTLVGLLRAAGCPSTDHRDSLKRSARPAISLLRYLCLEFDRQNHKNLFLGELNGFAQALCALNVPQLRTLRLDIHIGKGDNEGGSRGGSKDDACHLMALILARHTDTDCETPKPVDIKDFLPAGESRAEFDNWLMACGSATVEVRRIIQENISAAAAGKGRSAGNTAGVADAASSAVASTKKTPAQVSSYTEDSNDDDDDNVLGVFGNRSASRTKKPRSLLVEGGMDGVEIVTGFGGGTKAAVAAGDDKPTQWCQTQMASVTERSSIFLEEEVSVVSGAVLFAFLPSNLCSPADLTDFSTRITLLRNSEKGQSRRRSAWKVKNNVSSEEIHSESEDQPSTPTVKQLTSIYVK